MRRLFITSVVLGFLLTQSFAQRKTSRFEDYPISRVFTGKSVRIDLSSHPKARLYRTMLQLHAKDGVNFAGHYILAKWGCGSNCLSIAIIDARNGKVFFPPELPSIGVGVGIGIDVDKPLQFNAESNLLVAIGYPFFSERANLEGGEFYYIWKNNSLKLIHRVKKTYKEPN